MAEEVKSTEAASGKQLKVTLLRSPIRARFNHKDTIRALGLRRINYSHILPDNPAVRGMIATVRDWVKVEEVNS
jgi:large subunit ribosomal protein L30